MILQILAVAASVLLGNKLGRRTNLLVSTGMIFRRVHDHWRHRDAKEPLHSLKVYHCRLFVRRDLRIQFWSGTVDIRHYPRTFRRHQPE